MSKLENVKAEVEHLIAIGRLTFREGADRIEAAARETARDELEHFGQVQAREVQKRPWAVPALAIVAVSEGLIIIGGVIAWMVSP